MLVDDQPFIDTWWHNVMNSQLLNQTIKTISFFLMIMHQQIWYTLFNVKCWVEYSYRSHLLWMKASIPTVLNFKRLICHWGYQIKCSVISWLLHLMQYEYINTSVTCTCSGSIIVMARNPFRFDYLLLKFI